LREGKQMSDVMMERFRCSDIHEFVGNRNAKILTKEFMQHPTVPLLYVGPAGCGKTTLALLVARSLDKPYTHYNVSGMKREDFERMSVEMNTKSIDGRTRIIILDEIDGIDKRMQKHLLKAVNGSKSPCILICNFDNKVSSGILKKCRKAYFKKPDVTEIRDRLTTIVEKNSLNVEEHIINEISINSDTIRTAINILDTFISGGGMLKSDVEHGERILNKNPVGLMKTSVIDGIRTRQKLTPSEIVVYLHDSNVNHGIVSKLDIIDGRSRMVGYRQWRYFFSIFDNVRHSDVVNFPRTWMLIGKMKSRRPKKRESVINNRKLTKKEIEITKKESEEKRTKSLEEFF
jgi:DNA polymerase III delta prime subunit